MSSNVRYRRWHSRQWKSIENRVEKWLKMARTPPDVVVMYLRGDTLEYSAPLHMQSFCTNQRVQRIFARCTMDTTLPAKAQEQRAVSNPKVLLPYATATEYTYDILQILIPALVKRAGISGSRGYIPANKPAWWPNTVPFMSLSNCKERCRLNARELRIILGSYLSKCSGDYEICEEDMDVDCGENEAHASNLHVPTLHTLRLPAPTHSAPILPTPTLFAPTLPVPTLFAPTLIAPSLPVPTLLAPTLPVPALIAPSLHVPTLLAPMLTVPNSPRVTLPRSIHFTPIAICSADTCITPTTNTSTVIPLSTTMSCTPVIQSSEIPTSKQHKPTTTLAPKIHTITLPTTMSHTSTIHGPTTNQITAAKIKTLTLHRHNSSSKSLQDVHTKFSGTTQLLPSHAFQPHPTHGI